MTLTTTRFATPADAARLARMHADRIDEGFLASLGVRFLTRLYRRIARSRRAFAVVVELDGEIVAFCAAAEDVSKFYREFVVRDGVVAGLGSVTQIVRALPHVLETFRYPATTRSLPSAEILAVVSDAGRAKRGLGSTVLFVSLCELARRGRGEVKVVAGAENEAALRLYESAGFNVAQSISIHDDVPSEVLVWASS